MNFLGLFRRALPYLAAIAVFWVVSAIYFAPQLAGDTLSMNDVTMYDGAKADISAHRAAFGEDPQWTGGMFGGMPAYSISVLYPAMILRNGAQWLMGLMGEPMALMFLAMLGFWLMLLLCGVNPWLAIPFALAYGLSTYNILIIEAGHITKMRAMGYAPMLVGAVFHTFRRNVWIGGALAALFGTLQIAAAHPQITYYFLLVIAAFWINEFVATIRDKGWGADVIKPGEGIQPRRPGQIGKYSPLGSVKLFSIRKGLGEFWKATGVLILAAVLSVGANFTHLWYTMEHVPDTTRGGSELVTEESVETAGLDLDYATQWSYGIGESLNMFIPNLRGGSSWGGFAPDGEVAAALRQNNLNPSAVDQLPTYWGDQPGTGGPTYLGAVLVFLFVLGMFALPARQKWWVLGVSVFALLLAWGRNAMWFTELSFAVLPGYNKFRTVAMALAVLQWSVPFVAALAVSGIWRGEFSNGEDISAGAGKKRFMRSLAWAVGLTGGTALLFALFGRFFFDFSMADEVLYYEEYPGLLDALRSERAAMLSTDAWRSLLFVLLTAGVVWMWVSRSSWRKALRWIPVTALSALILADLVPIDLRFLSHDDFRTPSSVKIKPNEADLTIMNDPEPGFRVFNLAYNPFNEAYTSYFHRSIGGYHAAKLGRYQDVIDTYLSRELNPHVLSMLNTKYFITAERSGGVVATAQSNSWGAAWFVDRVIWVKDAQAELTALKSPDLRHIAYVDERFRGTVGDVEPVKEMKPMFSAEIVESATDEAFAEDMAEDTSNEDASIELVEYRPNYLKYESSTSQEQVAVFSEIYYDKGWTAYIDGEQADYFRANYILRAMVVPAGEHTIEWRFRAPHFATLEGITLGSSIAVLLWLAAALFFERRKRLASDNS